jgi:hypothetical protein
VVPEGFRRGSGGTRSGSKMDFRGTGRSSGMSELILLRNGTAKL